MHRICGRGYGPGSAVVANGARAVPSSFGDAPAEVEKEEKEGVGCKAAVKEEEEEEGGEREEKEEEEEKEDEEGVGWEAGVKGGKEEMVQEREEETAEAQSEGASLLRPAPPIFTEHFLRRPERRTCYPTPHSSHSHCLTPLPRIPHAELSACGAPACARPGHQGTQPPQRTAWHRSQHRTSTRRPVTC
ncbi:hypothetical protein CYMTET_53985 [Cymbomonas tetramitiformis]|uniref:Uncharacterized protein n=1 Tax=Cymbomonas tetramitiformis TaxID=36881 RepID=A0AAE0EPT5_9CHLO|nr:hypothetical protein CYMTET_53985 [Cymbomonas tetramitiformis]